MLSCWKHVPEWFVLTTSGEMSGNEQYKPRWSKTESHQWLETDSQECSCPRYEVTVIGDVAVVVFVIIA